MGATKLQPYPLKKAEQVSRDPSQAERMKRIIQYYIDMGDSVFIPTDRLRKWKLPGYVQHGIDRLEAYISQLEMDNCELMYKNGQLQDKILELQDDIKRQEYYTEIALNYADRCNG